MKNIQILFMVFICIALLGWMNSASALTPAGTDILNQSSITYRDAAGNTQTVNSNAVHTIVLPIYGLTITPDGTVENPGQTQNASPGATVYFQYTLINTGNDVDSYEITTFVDPSSDYTPSNIQVYYDTNGNGVIDPGEDTLPNDILADVPPNTPLSLIVTYTVPAFANADEEAFVDIRGVSVNDANQTDIMNFHRTYIIDDAVIVANKSVTPAEAAAGDTLTYTINGSNTGNLPTGIDTVDVGGVNYYGVLIADPLPTYNGVPFLSIENSAYGTPNGGTVLYMVGGSPSVTLPTEEWGGVWQTDYSENATAIAYITGNTTPGTGEIIPGQSFSFVFKVRVPIEYPAGTVNNVAVIEYDQSDGDEETTQTNVVSTIIGEVGYRKAAVMIGPHLNPKHHDLAIAGEDTTVIDTISASQSKSVKLTVYNAGNQSDVFNIQVIENFRPEGWNVQFFHLDGVTPLGDTNSDGMQDIGTLQRGDSTSFISKVTVPADQPPTIDELVIIEALSSIDTTGVLPNFITSVVGYSDGDNYDEVTLQDATGLSVGDILNIDHVTRRISEIDGNVVTVVNLEENPLGQPVTGIIIGKNRTKILFQNITGAALVYMNRPPANPDSVTKAGVAGEKVDFPLTIVNPALMNDTYTLTHTPPAGWTVLYYKDDNNDSIPDNLSPITSISVVAGGSRGLVARVSIPQNEDFGTFPITYIATSTNDPTITDQFTDYVVIDPAPDVLLDPNRNGTGIPGYTIEYFHQLINNGNTVLPTNSYFTVNSDHGWTYVLYQEDPGNPGTFTQLQMDGDHYLLGYEVGIGETVPIKVKVFIPSSAPEGTVETGVITIVGQGVAEGATDSATDITTVVNGNIFQEKRVVNITTESDTTWENATDYNQGLPGDTLKYYVHYKNIGNADVDSVTIYDAIPTYTDYLSNTAQFEAGFGSGAIEFSSDGGATWSAIEPDGVDVTNIRWHHADGGILTPGETGRISFKVVIE